MKNVKDLLWLLYINMFISAFTFGGGYVVIVMIRKYYVKKKQYFDEDELMKIAAIAQSSPGAISINMTGLAGYRVAGVQGLFTSCIAAIIPPLIILSIVSSVYNVIYDNEIISAILKGMEAGVAAMIVELVYDMYKMIIQEKSLLFILLTPCVFILNYFFNVNVLLLIFVSVLLCVFQVKRQSVEVL